MNSDYYTSVGGRDINEDSLYVSCEDEGCLLMVADGLGGHISGEKASQTAVNTISSYIQDTNQVKDEDIFSAVCEADRIIAKQYPGARTTIALLFARQGFCCAAHVGDSRIYQFRNGEIIFQSRDHSICQMYVMTGEITPSQIRGHAERNMLLRALGGEERARIDLSELDVQKNDAFLLCTDGFWENILEEEMVDQLDRSGTASEWLSAMRSIVESRMKQDSDNNTAVVVMCD